jgi:hypothetical protein
LNTDHGFKAAFQTLENKNGNDSITSKLNSTFGGIGKATADKMTAKVIGKNSSFHFNVKNLFENGVMQRSMSAKF